MAEPATPLSNPFQYYRTTNALDNRWQNPKGLAYVAKLAVRITTLAIDVLFYPIYAALGFWNLSTFTANVVAERNALAGRVSTFEAREGRRAEGSRSAPSASELDALTRRVEQLEAKGKAEGSSSAPKLSDEEVAKITEMVLNSLGIFPKGKKGEGEESLSVDRPQTLEERIAGILRPNQEATERQLKIVEEGQKEHTEKLRKLEVTNESVPAQIAEAIAKDRASSSEKGNANKGEIEAGASEQYQGATENRLVKLEKDQKDYVGKLENLILEVASVIEKTETMLEKGRESSEKGEKLERRLSELEKGKEELTNHLKEKLKEFLGNLQDFSDDLESLSEKVGLSQPESGEDEEKSGSQDPLAAFAGQSIVTTVIELKKQLEELKQSPVAEQIKKIEKNLEAMTQIVESLPASADIASTEKLTTLEKELRAQNVEFNKQIQTLGVRLQELNKTVDSEEGISAGLSQLRLQFNAIEAGLQAVTKIVDSLPASEDIASREKLSSLEKELRAQNAEVGKLIQAFDERLQLLNKTVDSEEGISAGLSQLRLQFNAIEAGLQSATKIVDSLPASENIVSLEMLAKEKGSILEKLKHLQQQLEELKQSPVAEQVKRIEASLQAMAQTVASLPASENIVSQDILAKEKGSILEKLKHLQQQFEELKQSPVAEQIKKIEASLQAVTKTVDSIPASENIVSQDILAKEKGSILEKLENLQQQFEKLKQSSVAEQIKKIEARLQELNEAVDAKKDNSEELSRLRLQLEELKQSLPKQEIANIQKEVKKLVQTINAFPKPEDICSKQEVEEKQNELLESMNQSIAWIQKEILKLKGGEISSFTDESSSILEQSGISPRDSHSIFTNLEDKNEDFDETKVFLPEKEKHFSLSETPASLAEGIATPASPIPSVAIPPPSSSSNDALTLLSLDAASFKKAEEIVTVDSKEKDKEKVHSLSKTSTQLPAPSISSPSTSFPSNSRRSSLPSEQASDVATDIKKEKKKGENISPPPNDKSSLLQRVRSFSFSGKKPEEQKK